MDVQRCTLAFHKMLQDFIYPGQQSCSPSEKQTEILRYESRSIGRHSKNVSLVSIFQACHEFTGVGLERNARAQTRQLGSPVGMAIYRPGPVLQILRIQTVCEIEQNQNSHYSKTFNVFEFLFSNCKTMETSRPATLNFRGDVASQNIN